MTEEVHGEGKRWISISPFRSRLYSWVAPTPVNRAESRLMKMAALFLFSCSLALSLSPAARARSWQVVYRWDHWLGFALWLVIFSMAHAYAAQRLPRRDPYLLPVGALLSGWGLITIWRLSPDFGVRQSIWLAVAVLALVAGLCLPGDLVFLRRYKYLWLTGSLLLVTLTLFFGTNPSGFGPRMWLGCCASILPGGIFLQPSEPLKLLLIAYLAAYMADRTPFLHSSTMASSASTRSIVPLLPTLAPSLIMTGLALALLVIQRDLGTAAMFLLLYAGVVYVTTGRRGVLVVAFITLMCAGVAGYWLFDVVRVRVDAWLNPWLDPSGKSYQIVQSLIALANGGLIGRGSGMGNPGLVPVAHSDLIFTAITEEHGLLGAIGLLILISLLASRGLSAALTARDTYRRYLAVGLSTYIAGQGLLIIGGNLRLLPLTGVTLPFISYGGSSLLVSYISLVLLMQISNRGDTPALVLQPSFPYTRLTGFFFVGFFAAALATGWWVIYRGPVLLARTDNPRRSISDRYVKRGSILDRDNQSINASVGMPSEYVRRYFYPDLSNIVGYNDPTYGQSGLEASLDDTLRGLKGNPGLSIWWNHLLYGQPPPGLDVRLSLDLDLQRMIDDSLEKHRGALVAINAGNGEILSMASHPTFDANQLEEQWESVINNTGAPLLNRATQGRYPVGDLRDMFSSIDTIPSGSTPPAIGEMLWLSDIPILQLPAGEGYPDDEANPAFSPIQIALAAAAVSSGGTRPAPQIVTAVNTPQAGWIILPSPSSSRRVIDSETAERIAALNAIPRMEIWQKSAVLADASGQKITWYLGGTLPGQQSVPYAIALILEEGDQQLAEEIGQSVLLSIIFPR